MYNTKVYKVHKGVLKSIWDALTEELEDSFVTKSSDGDESREYNLFITTIASPTTYNTYTVTLNEMEAHFDSDTNEVTGIILRDTSVHKKIEFSNNKGVLTYSRGRDVVGVNSELNDSTTKEPIYNIKINGVYFEAPYDLSILYRSLVGNPEEVGENSDEESYTFWYDLLMVKD